MKALYILAAPLAALVSFAAVPTRGETPIAAVTPQTVECEGPVTDCTSKTVDGTFGCTSVRSVGDTEKEARKEGLEQCEVDLGSAHGASFKCRDASRMKCHAATWKWVCRGPVPGCKSKKGETAGCASAEGVGDSESFAKDDALDACTTQLRESHGGRWSCDDTSKLACAKTN